MNITFDTLPVDLRKSCPNTFQFGQSFSDHMFSQHYEDDKGWNSPRIDPYHMIALDPAASVFHYGQEIFEGLKAYYTQQGNITLFRPIENCKRFNRSAKRMVMPQVDEASHLNAIKALIQEDKAWVPRQPNTSLYIRPTMIATGRKLGLGPSTEYLHYIITSPAGSYFGDDLAPISVHITERYRRASKGGVGEAKTGGNYAASLLATEEVAEAGFSQVLWLDAAEGRFIEEVGAMNICFVYRDGAIVTPALSGSILPGITRDSIIKLAPTLGYEVLEQKLDVNKILADITSGKISECFGCGTAAVISPVGRLHYLNKHYEIHENQTGPVAKQLFNKLTAIQYEQEEDCFNWIERVV